MPSKKYNDLAIEVVAEVFKITENKVRVAVKGTRQSVKMKKIKFAYDTIAPKATLAREQLKNNLKSLKFLKDLL